MVGSKIKRPHHSSLMPPSNPNQHNYSQVFHNPRYRRHPPLLTRYHPSSSYKRHVFRGRPPKGMCRGGLKPSPTPTPTKENWLLRQQAMVRAMLQRQVARGIIRPVRSSLMGMSPPCVCGLISSPHLPSFNVASVPDRRSPRDVCLSLPRKPKQQTPATWPV